MCVQSVQSVDCQAVSEFGGFEQSLQCARESAQADANSCANKAQEGGCGASNISQSTCGEGDFGVLSSYDEIATAARQDAECKQLTNNQNDYSANPYGDWLAARAANGCDQL